MKLNKATKYFTLILIFHCLFTVAQGPGFNDDVDDVAPIPGIVFALIAAIGIGCFKLLKRNH